MIIDSLTHITPDGKWFSTSYDASVTRLLKEMDQAQVDKAVVVALADHIENEFVAQTCGQYPDRLIAGASINPAAYKTPKQAKDALQFVLANGEFAVLKLHPRLNQYDPLDARCLAILEGVVMSQASIPILLDTFLYFCGGRLQKPPVDTIHELVGRFPSLTFVLLHGGGAHLLQLAEAIRACPNVFLDISYTIQRYRGSSVEMDLKYLFQIFDRRMIFGSDFPEVSIPDALAHFRTLSLDISPEKRDRILGDNLQALLSTTN